MYENQHFVHIFFHPEPPQASDVKLIRVPLLVGCLRVRGVAGGLPEGLKECAGRQSEGL